MGMGLNFSCSNCGYACCSTLGGSRASFQTHSPFPVYCSSCNDVRASNSIKSLNTCLKCGSAYAIPYGNPKVTALADVTLKNGDYFSNFDLKLPKRNNLCPKCGLFSGEFQMGILFD